MPKRNRRTNSNISDQNDSSGLKCQKVDTEQTPHRSHLSFTIEEKRDFLKACQENGLNIIYDIKKLKQYLPTRSEAEIKYLVELIERRSRPKKDGEECKDTPLEVWYSICDRQIRSQIKKEDSSLCLINLMERYQSTKYGSVYSNLKELMEGKYPSRLSVHDSIVFLSLINELTELTQSVQSIEGVKEYILELQKHLLEQQKKSSNLSGEEDCKDCLNYFDKTDHVKLKRDICNVSSILNNDTINTKINSNFNHHHPKDNWSTTPEQFLDQQFVATDASKTIEQTDVRPRIIQQSNSNTSSQALPMCDDVNVRNRLISEHSSRQQSNIPSPDQSPSFVSIEANPLYHYSQLPKI